MGTTTSFPRSGKPESIRNELCVSGLSLNLAKYYMQTSAHSLELMNFNSQLARVRAKVGEWFGTG